MEKLSGIIGLELERVPEPGLQPVAPGIAPLTAFTPDPVTTPRRAQIAIDLLAEGTAADLADAFGADFAGFSRALRDATGPDDLLRRLQPVVAGFAPHRAARILEETLAAATANGFLCGHHAAQR